MKSGKNTAASVRQRLLNIARNQKVEFQLILTHFALERFLFRISKSEHANDFVLKGAMLFQVWSGAPHRPTRDLDLLGRGAPDIAYFTDIISRICGLDYPDDGLFFQADSILLERIKEEDEYQGLRATLTATLDSARIPLQIDIGFGDAIVPTPLLIEYPTLLDLPSPILKAYAKETVIAEKFHAMVHRGIANSRMKDFYDVWILATTYHFEASELRAAIRSTFERRETELPTQTPLALTDEFAQDPTKTAQWLAFVKKGKLFEGDVVSFPEILPTLEKFIMLALTTEDAGSWDPQSLEWTTCCKLIRGNDIS